MPFLPPRPPHGRTPVDSRTLRRLVDAQRLSAESSACSARQLSNLPRAKPRADALIAAGRTSVPARQRASTRRTTSPNARREFDARRRSDAGGVRRRIPATARNIERKPGRDGGCHPPLTIWRAWAHRRTLEEGKFEKAPLEDILQMTFPVDPRLKDKVREQVAATVSQLPLTVNDAVLGYINYFSNRGHQTIVAAIERSGRYRPMIQRILDEEGVPQELIHLAQAESGFIPRAVSRMAAGGMWQFVKWRGNEYGLKQTPYTDDRMDPGKGHARGRPPSARSVHRIRRLVSGAWRLTTAVPAWWRRRWSAPAMPISGNCAAAACCPPRPPTTCPSFWP